MFAPARWFHHRWHRTPWLFFWWALVFGMLFLLAAEWFFWQEFRTRFNFIAVDYLLYTREVIGNIRESYPVGRILLVLAALAAFIVWSLRHRLMAPLAVPRAEGQSLGRRLLWGLPLFLAPVLVFTWVDRTQRDFSANPLANEIAGDGLYEFFSAAYRNELDYATHYASVDMKRAHALVRAGLETRHSKLTTPGGDGITRTVRYAGEEKRLNVMMISVESLSADFMAKFGNQKGLTPRLDALADKSLFFTRLYATGTRTVRGLEALSIAYPPTPGPIDREAPSITKTCSRSARCSTPKGYDVRYLYGGYAYFDNMREFFLGQRLPR